MINYAYLDVDFDSNKSGKIFEFVKHNLIKYGMSLENFSGIAFSISNIKNFLSTCNNDLIFVKLSTSFDKNKQLKEFICDCFKTFLTKNTASKFAIESYLRLCKTEIENLQDFENESLIPDGAEPLNSDLGFVQGFMLNYKNINICFLPPEIEQVKDIMKNRIPDILARLYKVPTEFIYLKTFGLTEEQLWQHLSPFIKNSLNLNINIEENCLDALITIGYNSNIAEDEINNFVAQICETLKKYLYATEDSDIVNIAFDLIKMTNKKLALVESFTNTKCYYNFSYKNDGQINDNLTYYKSVNKVADLFDLHTLDKDLLSTKGLFSVDSIYEISTAIINETNTDIVSASLVDYNEYTKVANSFLSIGDQDGIHIYKHTYVGDKEDLQEIVCKNLCFYLIRKLKQNDLIFDQTLSNM